jgi:uncharacterized FAD-dependent dehydrogenase
MKMDYDIIIVGAGPAGLFAAYEIINTIPEFKILVIDEGKDIYDRVCITKQYSLCAKCNPCNIMSGMGGAGLLSSGLLNLRPEIGGDFLMQILDIKELWQLVEYVDKIFVKYGAPNNVYNPPHDKVRIIERKAASVGVRFIPIRQRLIGSDNSMMVINNFKLDLEKKGVKFMLNTLVSSFNKGYVQLGDGRKLTAKYLLIAPGRIGAKWLNEEAKKLKLKVKYEPLDVGVRVEVPAIVMNPICTVNRDPKFHIYTSTYDDFVRTFCVNHRGFVVQEVYEGFVGVNGHSFTGEYSENTNFALLVRVKLTEPLEDTSAYGRAIAAQATILGGGKPIIQRLGDLKAGRRSLWSRIARSNVKPTLQSVTPGDIAMALPHRIVTDILEGLDKLDKIIPGVASPSTLLYAPEIKFSACRIGTNNVLETEIENVFVAGDGAGISRGIVAAAISGIVAAKGIIEKEKQ